MFRATVSYSRGQKKCSVEMSSRNLLVFNLATDADDPILAFTSAWLNALAAHFERIDVITMRMGRLALATNITVHSLGKEKGASEALRLWRFYRILLHCMRQRTYVGCFAHMQPLFTTLAGPWLLLRDVPIVLWYAHGNVPWHLRTAERLVGKILTSTTEGCRISSRKIQVVGQGIDTEHFHLATPILAGPRPFTLLYIGRLDPIKRLEILLAAAENLAEQATFSWQLHIVGEASLKHREYATRLRNEAEMRFGEHIHFLGSRTYAEMPTLYQSADLLWSASGTGSLDKVLLEAMACGLPILTSNEAASGILQPWAETSLIPPELSFEESSRLFATKTIRFRERSTWSRRQLGNELRQFIVEQHNLRKLAERIAGEFSM